MGTRSAGPACSLMSQHTPEPPNPAVRYDTPKQLARDWSLPLTERMRLLEEWEDDVRGKLVASEEGMTGPSDITLADILEAKAALPIDAPARPDTPSKA
jgi:hypothetical protein